MRILLIILGFLCVLLAVIGIFLPIMPTTPFILLAAYLFSKSSDRFYQWLVDIPAFGKMIRNWNEYGGVSIKAKTISAVAMTGAIIYICIFREYSIYLKAAVATCMLMSMAYVLTRPIPPKTDE